MRLLGYALWSEKDIIAIVAALRTKAKRGQSAVSFSFFPFIITLLIFIFRFFDWWDLFWLQWQISSSFQIFKIIFNGFFLHQKSLFLKFNFF